MLIFSKQVELRAHLDKVSTSTKTIGFVPTMGALHDGHLSLLKTALHQNKLVVMSIFVNPTQFNNAEDLEKYPRNLDNDVKKIATLSNEIIVFAPTVDDIYNGNTVSEKFSFDGLENQMEGKYRPGHFDGVGTIVKRLFEIVQPNNAYFGEKDFQQLQIIKKMVEIHQLPVNVIGCPILREDSGLAMSSRNERLNDEEKNEATLIYKTISEVKNRFSTQTIESLLAYVENVFNDNDKFELDYVEIADEETLEPSKIKLENKKYRIFIAVYINNVRLIDTISLN
jgi:pantoate--beta-alanine ligase